MPLKDLFAVARQKKISLVARIDDFLATEAHNLATGKIQEKDLRIREAEIERQLAEQKLKRWKTRDVDSRKHFLHPSSLMGCARAFCYKFMDAPAKESSYGGIEATGRTMRIFSNGDMYHLRMQALFIRMGIAKLEDVEVEFDRGDEQGTADILVRLDNVRGVVDFKSANEYAFNAVQQSRPDHKHEMQLRVYMEKFGVKFGILLYENKNTQLLKEVVLLRNKMKEDELRQRRDYIRAHIHKRKLADREGKTKTTIPCSRCVYRHLCYDAAEEKKWRDGWSKAKRVLKKEVTLL